jgi:hypothetical protein
VDSSPEATATRARFFNDSICISVVPCLQPYVNSPIIVVNVAQ